MLRIYPVVLDLLATLKPRPEEIERADADLARQMRRAMQSSVLNLGEGMYSRGRNRKARYHTALGSVRETESALEVAVVFGFVPPLPHEVHERFRQVIGTLCKLMR